MTRYEDGGTTKVRGKKEQPRAAEEALRAGRRGKQSGSPTQDIAFAVPFQAVLENIVDGFLALDQDYRCTYVNKAAAAFLSATADAMIGRPIWGAFPAARYPQLHDQITYAAEQRVFVRFDEYCQRSGRWFAWRCYPTDDSLAVFIEEASERKRTEEALRESEQRYRKLFQASLVGVYLTRLDGTILDFNEAMMKMLGYDAREEVFLHHSSDFYADPQVRNEAILLLQKDGVVPAREAPLYRKDGSILHALGSAMLLTDERTGETYIQGMAVDITKRKEAEQALHESEQRLRAALENSLEGGRMGRWEWDLRTDSMFWCRRIYELLGLDPSARADLGAFLDRVHPDDREAVRAHLAKTRRDQTNLEVEFRVFRQPQDPRGEISWLASHAKAICADEGQTLRIIGVMYNITRRKQMEDRLRRQNDQLTEEVESQTEQLRSTAHRLQNEAVGRVVAEGELRKQSQMLEGFFLHTITPLAFLDRHFHFVRVNQAFAQAAGQDPESLIGKDYFVLHPHEDREIFARVARTKVPYFAPARPLPDPHNRRAVTYWDWQLTPLLDSSGQLQSLVLNCEDVTQQQEAYSELEHRARQLQKLALELSETEDRERERLAEILHDDLQQTLAAAKFHLGLMRNQLKQNASLQAAAGEIDAMLRDAIAKSRSLSHELSPAVLHQGDFAETLTWLADEMQAKHGLTVQVQVCGELDVSSQAIRAFLYKATQELLFNIVKHARVSEAALRVRRRGPYLSLSISDQGRGFDLQNLKETNGFGLLGLRERAELLGGRMTIRSARGQGSTFRITVPDTEGVVGSRTSVVGEEKAPSDRRLPATDDRLPLRVLLADDHEIVREGLTRLLNEEPTIQVVGEASNGREAVDLAEQLRPDVVVLDVSMPVMSGVEAARQIKTELPEVRIVALSMFEDAAVRERMHGAGADGYVIKTDPFDGLLAAIHHESSDSE